MFSKWIFQITSRIRFEESPDVIYITKGKFYIEIHKSKEIRCHFERNNERWTSEKSKKQKLDVIYITKG